MSVIDIKPLVLKDFILQIGVDQFEKNVSSVLFTPSATTITWQGGTPSASFTDTSTASWVAAITFAQDWDTVNSLSQYLYNNEGVAVPAVFRPRNGVGPSFSTTLVITPGAIGGAVNVVSDATVTLGVQGGKPQLIPGTPTIPTITAATPATGPIAGGTLVKISGTKFTGTTSVKFGTTAATFTIDSDGTIYAIAPAQAAGSKPITVTNAVGVSTTSGAYTYA